MKVFISGGCKNGKSTYAERIAAALSKHAKPLYYVATMLPADDEDKARIARHRQSRKDMGFKTVEIASDIINLKNQCDMKGTFLLDSTTALLANEMFPRDGKIHTKACVKVADGLLEILNIIENIVVVSDYIYSDAVIYDELTEEYRRGLAFADRCCAKACDVVIEVCYGNLIVHKGKEMFGEFYEKIT